MVNTWYKGESSVYPVTVDTTSSRKWVYVRRNIREEERIEIEDDQEITKTIYTFEESKIPKDVYVIFENEQDNADRISDIEDVVAELLGGGDIV